MASSKSRRFTTTRSAESNSLSHLDSYEKAYLKIAESGIRGSLLEIPEEKILDTTITFDRSTKSGISSLSTINTCETKTLRRSLMRRVCTTKHVRFESKRRMISNFYTSEKVNNALLKIYNPVIYNYDNRTKSSEHMRAAPSEKTYTKELQNVEMSVKKFMGCKTYVRRPSCHRSLTELLGLPEIKQYPKQRRAALKKALITKPNLSKEERAKVIVGLTDPHVKITNAQRGLMSSEMLQQVLFLNNQPEDIADIPNALKHLEEMLRNPNCPTSLFKRILYGYHSRRAMVSKFSNQFIFYRHYTPRSSNKEAMTQLMLRQKQEMLRHLKIRKGALDHSALLMVQNL